MENLFETVGLKEPDTLNISLREEKSPIQSWTDWKSNIGNEEER